MYHIKKAVETDVEEIFQLLNDVHDGMEDPSLLVLEEIKYVEENIKEKGFTVVACDEQGEIKGVFIFTYPMDSEENLGLDLGFDAKELRKVVHVDTAAVAAEARGNGLQLKMLQYGEALINKDQYCHLLSTVSPDNPASYSSLEKNGYTVLMTKEKYGGLLRRIYYKKI